MLIAFLWWAILLSKKNKALLSAEKQFMESVYHNEGLPQEFSSTSYEEAMSKLEQKANRQQWMIIGEGAVFCITLLSGLYLIHRSYRREMSAAEQQRNFLLSITHELKSPIASIKLAVETMIKRALNSDQKEKIGAGALQETNRLHELVNDLLLSARLDANFQPDIESFNLSDFIERQLNEFRKRHPEVKVDLIVPPQAVIVQADIQSIQTILSNLMENGVKYNPSASKKISIELKQSNGVQINIADNGKGIPEAERQKIFQKFYRVGNEDTRSTKGTGLGLYIVKELVTIQKGNIEVVDNDPVGSIFKLWLPSQQNLNK